MIHTYTGATFASIYRQQLKDLVDKPDYIVTVRGRPTREMLNVVTEITNPRARCQIVPGRKLNPWLALSESFWLLAGRNDVASLLPYNKNITRFSDDGKIMYGAYGHRMSDQIETMISRLEAYPEDRRAVLQIWKSADLIAETADPPCNQQVMFKVRDEKLHMTVTCRSNDLHWGLAAVNTFQFGILQEYIACRLGVGMGTQTHLSNSLHIYTDKEGQAVTDKMMAAMSEPLVEIPAEAWLFHNPFSEEYAEDFPKACGAVLDGTFGEFSELPFFEFAEDFLRFYREKKPIEIRHAKMFNSWVEMGKEFLGVHNRTAMALSR